MYLVRHWNWRSRDYGRGQDHPLHGPMRDEAFESKEGAIARIRELGIEKFGEDIVEEDAGGWIVRQNEKDYRVRGRREKYQYGGRAHRWWYRVDPA